MVSAMLLASPLAQATTLSAGTAVEVGVADADFDNLADTLVAGTVSTDTDSSLYEYSYEYSGDWDWASSAAAVNQDGWMYATAGGDNTFKAASHVQQSLVIENDSGVDQSYSFDFTILQGSLSAYGENYDSNEFAAAGYYVSITLDGVSLFSSAALLQLNGSGASLQQYGTELAGYTAGSDYFGWGPYSDTLDLGVFAAGESFTLSYDILAVAAGVYAPENDYNDEWCYGGEIEGEFSDGYCGGWSYSYAQFGDPNGVSGSPIAGNVHGAPVSVPEPGIWLLMGTGLLGFAVARRRRS